MSNFKLEVKGLDAAIKRFGELPKEVEAKLQSRLNEFAILTVSDAKTLCPVDEGFLRNSIQPDIKRLSVGVVVAADYASYIEFGTRKYAAAYVSSLPAEWQTFAAQFKGGGGSFQEMVLRLTRWVEKKGIVTGGKKSASAARSAAYKIALSILRNGIRPQPFLYPAVSKNLIDLENNLKADFGQ